MAKRALKVFWFVEDLAKAMKKRRLLISTTSGIRKAIKERRLPQPTGRSLGRGVWIWSEADAQFTLNAEAERYARNEAINGPRRRR